MSLRRKILLGLVVLVILVPATLMFVVATTESGLRLVAQGLGKMGAITVTVRGVHGTLVRGFAADSVRIESKYSDILISNVQGKMRFAPLLVQTISFPDLSAESVHVLAHHFESDEKGSPHFLPRLLQIDAADARVGRAVITAPNGVEVVFTGISGAANVYPRQLRIRRAQAQFQDALFKASGRLLAAHPLGLEGDIDVVWQMPRQPRWHATAQIKGDFDALPMTVNIDKPFHAVVRGSALTLTTGWKFRGTGDVRDFDLQPFGGGKALGLISGKLDIQADPSGFAAQGALNPAGLAAGPLDVDFAGAYVEKKLLIKHADIRHAASRTDMKVSGTVAVVEGGPQLDLSGQWTDFRWPLSADKPAFSSPRGSLSLKGIRPWNLEAQGDVLADPLPLFQAKMQGALASDSLQIKSANLVLLHGTADLNGEVRWSPGESWRIKGNAHDVDPTLLRPDLPGRLSFAFDAKGAPFGNRGALDVAFTNLNGVLRGQKASGSGQILRSVGNDAWQFKGIDLRFGKTHLVLNGNLGTAPDLDFVIDADDLSLLDPEARGQVNARGRFAGPPGQRVIKLKAKGTSFEWHGSELAGLNADLNIEPGGAGKTEGTIELSGLKYGGRTLQSARVLVEGTNAAQQLTVGVVADPLRVSMTAAGAFHDGLWQGRFQSLDVISDSPLKGSRHVKLALEAPAPVQFSTKLLLTRDLCLKGEQERLCVSAERADSGAWDASFSATSLPLHMLTAGLSQDVTYEGTLNIEGKAAGTTGHLPTGEFHAQLREAVLHQALSNAREERMALGSGRVDATVTQDAFEAKVSLDAAESGNIRGELSGQRTGDEWRDYPIKGSLVATTDALGLLDVYLGSIDRATGRLSTNISIAGTLGKPEINGQLQLREAQLDVYQINLSLRDLSLDAKFNAENLEISGHSSFGAGTAKFHGNLAWRNREPFGELHVEGEHLRVVNVPEGQIDASPNLDFKLEGRRINASGEVLIPFARLAPADLTNAVLASSDEVLVGATPEDPNNRWIVTSNVKLVLGDQVNVDAFGLTARLGGSITLRSDDGEVTRGQGELNIVEGKFVALGRRLDIERGRLIFNNGPVNDPGVDLRAQKEFPNIIAGVNVRGTLRSQRMTFYSEPSIPQQQIATLILAGGTLDSAQSSSGNNAGRSALLAQGGAIFAQRYGSKVGIEDVGIESQPINGTSNEFDTSLVFGRYLSDRLYISYGISLAEAINTLKLRYTIGDRWTLKTESGKAQSADLEYMIRR
ncbi:MAG: translocation/assembly module TamB domain-containing protein [Pseudomonadota bacterium]